MRSVALMLILVVVPSVALGQPAGKDRRLEPLPPGAAFRLGSYQFWQDGAVGALALSPDGKVLASSSATAGRPIGKHHAQTKLGQGFRLWDTDSGEARPRPDPEVKHEVLDLGFSGDGKLFATATATEIQVWNTATARVVRRIPMPGIVSTTTARVAFSPDGSFLHATLVAHDRFDMDAFRWEAHTGKLLKTWRDRVAPVEAADEEKAKDREFQVSLAISPDGKRLFKGFRVPHKTSDKVAPVGEGPSAPTSLRVYDAASGQRVHQIDDLNVDVASLVFSADGKLFAFSGANAVHVGAVADPSPLRKIGGSARVLALSGDGSRLATVQPGGSLCLWDVDTGKRLHELCHASHTYDLRIAFSADGKTLAFSDTDWIRLFDTIGGGERLSRPGHHSPVTSVRFSGDGRTLISIGEDSLWRWHAATGKPIGSRASPEVCNQGEVLAWSNDGRFQAVRAEGGISLCDTGEPPALPRKLDCGEGEYFAARFSDDGRVLSVAVPRVDEPRFNLFDVPTGKVLGRGTLAKGSLQNAWSMPAVSPDGKHIAWWANDGRILLANHAGDIIRELHTAGNQRGAEDDADFIVPSQLLAFSPDGRYLFSAYTRELHHFVATPHWAICLWEVASGKEARRLDVRLPNGGPGCVACVAFSPDGATLAVGQYTGRLGADDGSPNPPITLWEVASGRMRLKLEGHRRPVTSLAFAPDGRTLASGSEDGTVLLWDLPRGSVPAAEMTAQRAETHWAELAGDDTTLACKAVWSLSAAPKFALPLLKRHLQPVPVVSQEPIRKLVADLGSDDFTVRDRAAQELENLGESAAPAVTKALAGKPSLESRRRVELLLAQVDRALSTPSGERLRLLRALEILARIGDEDAIQLLQTVAAGDPHARLSQEARAALDRRRINEEKK